MRRMSARPLVLIVESQPESMRLLANLLREADYDTTAATNEDDALVQTYAHRPDVAVLDLTLPGSAGLNLLRELHEVDPELPAIVITGNGSPDRAQAAMRNGAFDFFTMPFDNRELLVSLAEALSSRQAGRSRLEVSRV